MLIQYVHKLLQQSGIDEYFHLLETPTNRNMGDLALPCFLFAKKEKKSPVDIAKTIAQLCQKHKDKYDAIDKIESHGPYVNFFFSVKRLAKAVLPKIIEQKDRYGSGKKNQEHRLIESPGPNTNKPLHLGHVRNMLLGNSLSNIASFAGYTVHKVDIINDRGVHICKSMLAYQLRGNNQSPNKKTDHYVGDRYVRYEQEKKNNPKLEEKIHTMLQKREEGDTNTRSLRKKMRDRALQGIRETYKTYDCHIDKAYFESDHYLHGKNIVHEALKKGIFSKNKKGNIVFRDEQSNEKTVLRKDGTAIYITQDIALGKIRYEDWKMDRMIYVVGNEQEQHFSFLFKIFHALGFPFAQQCYHMSYGMIRLPDGKMKSREGNVVDADTLITEITQECTTLLKNRYPNRDNKTIQTTAHQIAMGAIKFFILKYETKKDFVFYREQSISFEGESGPYIQYTATRAKSILGKYEKQGQNTNKEGHDIQLLGNTLSSPEERILLTLLGEFRTYIKSASETYQPSLLAKYILDLAKHFNNYYQKQKIITDKEQETKDRIYLVFGVYQVLKNGLQLLGIEIPEKM